MSLKVLAYNVYSIINRSINLYIFNLSLCLKITLLDELDLKLKG